MSRRSSSIHHEEAWQPDDHRVMLIGPRAL